MAVELVIRTAEKALGREKTDGTFQITCPLNTICRKAPICTTTWEHARQMALAQQKDNLCDMRQAIINGTIPEKILSLIGDKILEHRLGPEFFGTTNEDRTDEDHEKNRGELTPKQLIAIVR